MKLKPFNGKHYPKIQSDSRKRMYELCFALNLSVEQTTWFFEHVYYDRCFNCHTITEAVYYYCFSHQLTYDTAKQLIEKVNAAPEIAQTDDFALHTRFIRNQIDDFQSPDELTSYLINNRESFRHWNVSALEQIMTK